MSPPMLKAPYLHLEHLHPYIETCRQSVSYEARAAARLRSLEGAICMPSRYLATVRRATGMPSCDKISASLESLHGLSVFSWDISFLILARIAVEDISVP